MNAVHVISTVRRIGSGLGAAASLLVLAVLLAAGACESGAPPRTPGPSASAEVVAAPHATARGAPSGATAPVFPPDWPYSAGAPTASSAHGVVTSDAALATKVGVDVLAAGGNAVDAAVATAFALAAAFPTAGNIGGGGFMVARLDGKSYALDFRETAPAAATRDMYIGPDGKPTHDSRDGPRSVGVPGSVAGLWEAWHVLGSKKKAWADLLAPAIALADGGFIVDDAFDKSIAVVQERLAKDPASSALFLPGGALPPIGMTWRDPELAAALRRIAAEGPPGFYEGPVAAATARKMKETGGLITLDDLKAYRAKWREPVVYRYRGRTVVGMPPPSSGGLTMAMIAHIVERWDVHALGWHSAPEIHLMAEAMRRAYAARNAKLGDPDFVTNPVAELLSDAWASSQRATVRMDRATATSELFPQVGGSPREGPHTTHLGVVDASGGAVALTTTLNLWFGSGITVDGAGFVLNDEMDDFAALPGTANAFGLVQGEPNAIAPGKRMLSSMSPTIVLGEGGGVDLVLGAAGGSRIITTVFQELSNAIDFGMGAGDAVRAPRFHQQDSPDVLLLEPHGLGADVIAELNKLGHATQEAEHLADAPGIGRVGGAWQAAAEPRRAGGLALGLP